MGINEELETYIKAFRVTEGTILPQLLERAQSTIEKLQHDIKVLRWALYQAREALMNTSSHSYGTVLSIIDNVESMTEPANDR